MIAGMRNSSQAGAVRLAWVGAAGAAVVVVVLAWVLLSRGPASSERAVDPAVKEREAREAKIAEIVRRVEELEGKGKWAEALEELGKARELDPKHASVTALETRLKEKLKRREEWRRGHRKAEELAKAAEGRDSLEAWRAAVEALEAAEKLAAGEGDVRLTRGVLANARQRFEWAGAREEEKKGNLDAALKRVEQALAAREAPPELVAYKATLEKKKRKQEFDRVAGAARGQPDPRKSLDLWKQAQPLAEDPKDVEEVRLKIDALLPLFDLAERQRRYEAAMTAAEAALGAGNLEAAERWFRDAQKLKAGDSKAGQGLARTETAQKQKAYEAAVAEGAAAERSKDWIGATAAYELALKLRPGDRQAAARLKEISTTHRPPRIEIVLDEAAKVKMEFVLVKPGQFVMGDPEGETDEKPHPVTFTKDLWVQSTEVTQGQWAVVMKNKPATFLGRGELPVESVSWVDAQKFLERLNEVARAALKGRKATLPTESEWEYACRAGTRARWSAGDSEEALQDAGWYTKNSRRETQAVAGKKPNAWGLYDMHGNVAEWCEDWYGPYPDKAADPAGPPSGQQRCLRGGAWNDRPETCRSANRERGNPERGSSSTGFRVVLR